MAGRTVNNDGSALFLADSHTASNTFGFGDSPELGLSNVPKTRFLFYAKFHRARSEGGTTWERGVGLAVKSIDRPRISFQTETLMEYNRKRVVQTKSDFEPVMFRFHDTVQEKVQDMFKEYYRYYYGDNDAFEQSTSQNSVINAGMDPAGPYGLKATPNSGHFFSKITIYQVFNRQVSSFEIINPKIQQFNPDEMDYASSNTHEIVMTFAYEGIVYKGITSLDSQPALLDELGLDKSLHYDFDDTLVIRNQPSMGTVPTISDTNTIDGVNAILRRQVSRALTGENVTVSSIAGDFLHSFDRNRGLSTVRLGTQAVNNLVSGNIGGAITAISSILGGKPGFPF